VGRKPPVKADEPTNRKTDPKLRPLQNNGGPTLTHAPLTNSPAIDKGKNLSGSSTDQRGLPRTANFPGITNAPGGDGTDIGAFERQASETKDAPVITSTNAATFATGFSNSFRIVALGAVLPFGSALRPG